MVRLSLVLYIMLAASVVVLFMCGYYVGIIKEKYGKNWLHAIPITIALLMFNFILVIIQLVKSGRWD